MGWRESSKRVCVVVVEVAVVCAGAGWQWGG